MSDKKKLEKHSDTKEDKSFAKNHSKRRKFLASITTGAAVAGAAAGGKWVKPVVDSVILPAHAQATPGVSPRIDMNITAQVSGGEFGAYAGIVYDAPGTYPLTSSDSSMFDHFQVDVRASFNPATSAPIDVNLDLNIDGDFDDLDVTGGSQSRFVSPGKPAVFNQVEVDVEDFDLVRARFTVRSDGFITRQITYVIT